MLPLPHRELQCAMAALTRPSTFEHVATYVDHRRAGIGASAYHILEEDFHLDLRLMEETEEDMFIKSIEEVLETANEVLESQEELLESQEEVLQSEDEKEDAHYLLP